MPSPKKRLEFTPKPDDQEIITRAIANSIQNLPVSGIVQLIQEGWLSDQEINQVASLLSEADKLKLKTALENASAK